MCIADFWADGLRTYTPPGHWNYIAATDFVQQNLQRTKMGSAIWPYWICHHGCRCCLLGIPKRFILILDPCRWIRAIKTGIGLPNFPAYISGHSTFSGAAATVLGYIIPSKAAEYNAMAYEASISRMYGAIHYRSDCEVGITTGNKVGAYAITRGHTDGAE